MKDVGKCTIESFPASRISTTDIGAVGLQKHHIKALLELDVTEARRLIAEKKKRHENVSFNAWLLKCIGHTVAEFPQLRLDHSRQRPPTVLRHRFNCEKTWGHRRCHRHQRVSLYDGSGGSRCH